MFYIWKPTNLARFEDLLSSWSTETGVPASTCKIERRNRSFELMDVVVAGEYGLFCGANEIFTLVPLRTLISIESSEPESREAFQDYEHVGRVIFQENLCQDLLDVVKSVWNWSKKLFASKYKPFEKSTPLGNVKSFNTPFVSVLLPSYSGKTEITAAFDNYSAVPFVPFQPIETQNLHTMNLPLSTSWQERVLGSSLSQVIEKYAQENERPVLLTVRLIMSTIFTQPVYDTLLGFSGAMLNAVKWDIAILNALAEGPPARWDDVSSPPVLDSERSQAVMRDYLAASKLCSVEGKFHTVGLIIRFIVARLSGEDRYCMSNGMLFKYARLSIAEGRSKIQEILALANKPIVFTLDEFNLSADDPYKRLQSLLIRNFLRELGIVTVLLGTDSKAPNLILPEAIGDTSRTFADPEMPWCYVISKLPGANANTLPMEALSIYEERFVTKNDFDSLMAWINSKSSKGFFRICQNPGVLKLFIQRLSIILEESEKQSVATSDLLKTAFEETGELIYGNKIAQKMGVEVKTGQFYMILAKHRRRSNSGVLFKLLYPPHLIHRHFAYLYLLKPAKEKLFKAIENSGAFSLSRSGSSLMVNGEKRKKLLFQPSSKFPSFHYNELLNMILLDNRTMQRWTENRTFATIGVEAHERSGSRTEGSCNPIAKSDRNGYLMENIMHGSTVLSTHQSLSGVQFGMFMEDFLRNLETEPSSSSSEFQFNLSECPLFFQNIWEDLLVPYIACVGEDSCCSQLFQSIPGIYTGVYHMVPNSDRHDGNLSSWFIYQLDRHVKTCDVCGLHGFSDISKFLENPDIIPTNCCQKMTDKLNSWIEKGLFRQTHLTHLMRLYQESKNWETPLYAEHLLEIVTRLAEQHAKDKLYDAISYHISMITTSRCHVQNESRTLNKIKNVYDGSIFMLCCKEVEGRRIFSFKGLAVNESSKKICLVISCEDVLNTDMSPLADRVPCFEESEITNCESGVSSSTDSEPDSETASLSNPPFVVPQKREAQSPL